MKKCFHLLWVASLLFTIFGFGISRSAYAQTPIKSTPLAPTAPSSQTCTVSDLPAYQSWITGTLESAKSRADSTISSLLDGLSKLKPGLCPNLARELGQIDNALKDLNAAFDEAIRALDQVAKCTTDTDGKITEQGAAVQAAINMKLLELQMRRSSLEDLRSLLRLIGSCSNRPAALLNELTVCKTMMNSGACTTAGGCLEINKCRWKIAEAADLLRKYDAIQGIALPIGSGGGFLGSFKSQMENLRAMLRSLEQALAKCLLRYQNDGGSEPVRGCPFEPSPAELDDQRKQICGAFQDPALVKAALDALTALRAYLMSIYDWGNLDPKLSRADMQNYLNEKCQGEQTPLCSAMKFWVEHYDLLPMLLREIARGAPSDALRLSDIGWILVRLGTLSKFCAPAASPPPTGITKNCCVCTYSAAEEATCAKLPVTGTPLTKVCNESPFCESVGEECHDHGWVDCKGCESRGSLSENGANCNVITTMTRDQFGELSTTLAPPPGFSGCSNLDVRHTDHYFFHIDDRLLPSYVVCLKASDNCKGIHCIATGCARFSGVNGLTNAVDRIATLYRLYGINIEKIELSGNQASTGSTPGPDGLFGFSMVTLTVNCKAGSMNVCPIHYPLCKDIVGTPCILPQHENPIPSCSKDGTPENLVRIECQIDRWGYVK